MSTKSIEDEAALIADLNATFPGARATSLRTWADNPKQIGAVVSGAGTNAAGLEIQPVIYPDHEAYDGRTLIEFEKWCNARGWYAETYDVGTLWVVPLPSQQELAEWRAFQEKLAQERALQPVDDSAPF